MVWLFQPLSGNGYQFWSGIGSDLGYMAIISGSITWFIHSRCHLNTCYKRGKYSFKQYKLCKKHHPDVPKDLTYLHIAKLHKKNK